MPQRDIDGFTTDFACPGIEVPAEVSEWPVQLWVLWVWLLLCLWCVLGVEGPFPTPHEDIQPKNPTQNPTTTQHPLPS